MMPAFIRPDGWLADEFGRRARRWAEEQGAAKTVAVLVGRAAALLSEATSAGHVCIHLRDVVSAVNATEPSALTLDACRQALSESRLVGTAADAGVMPLVLDDDDRLYLHRYFDYECRLARTLALRHARRGEPAARAILEPTAALLARVFPASGMANGEVDWQQVAVVNALQGQLTIISGGPGTGKTTAIVNLLACLLEENPACRIALAAPTGKAAVRIVETIRARAAHLPPRIIERLPQKSFTVHRLLGVLPQGGFAHHADNPLPIDALVVDEASMLDLSLATQLLEAVPPTARVILVGDKDQLAAVEAGAVFAEMSAGAAVGLEDAVVWLRHNYRFGTESSIGRLAEEIKAGDAAAVLARLHAASDSLTWFDDAAVLPSSAVIDALYAGYADYVEACRTQRPAAARVSEAFGRFRVLCAVREGPRGTVAINERVSKFFRKALTHPLDPGGRADWYPGRPVVMLRNDHPLRLFNGDIGIALPDANDRLMVYFPDAESGFRAVAPVRLPEHETAFAMTVHKAQGSEFDEVMMLLPATMNRVLTRELLYTGITRARARVTLAASGDMIAHAVGTPTVRLSGLGPRLVEAGADKRKGGGQRRGSHDV